MFAVMPLPLTRRNVARWRADGPALFDAWIESGAWTLDETDYGFGLALGFKAAGGAAACLWLAYPDRRDEAARNGPDDDRSYVLTVDEARAAINKAILPS